MAGDPILLRIFARSMRMDGILQGLPFYVAAVSIYNSTLSLLLRGTDHSQKVGFGMAAVVWRFVRLRMTS